MLLGLLDDVEIVATAADGIGAVAHGYVTEDANAEEIGHAIRAPVAGQTHLAGLPDQLTPREVEVLRLIAAGLSNRKWLD